jgi:hypothetical protein
MLSVLLVKPFKLNRYRLNLWITYFTHHFVHNLGLPLDAAAQASATSLLME